MNQQYVEVMNEGDYNIQVTKPKRTDAQKEAQERYYEKIKNDSEKYTLYLEKKADYRRKNKDKINEKSREYNKSEHRKEYSKEWREENKDKIKEYQNEYQKTIYREWRKEYMLNYNKSCNGALAVYHKKKESDPDYLKIMAQKKREYRARKKLEKLKKT